MTQSICPKCKSTIIRHAIAVLQKCVIEKALAKVEGKEV